MSMDDDQEVLNYEVYRKMTKLTEAVYSLMKARPFLQRRTNQNVLSAYVLHYYYGVPWQVVKNPETGGVQDMKLELSVFGKLRFITTLENINRARRKVCEKHPEMKGSEQTQLVRASLEEAYRDVMATM